MANQDRNVIVKISGHFWTLSDFSEVIEQASEGNDVVVLSRVHDPVNRISVDSDENVGPIVVPQHAIRLHFRKARDGEESSGMIYLISNPLQRRKELFDAVASKYSRHSHYGQHFRVVSKSGQVCMVSGRIPEGTALCGTPRLNDTPVYQLVQRT